MKIAGNRATLRGWDPEVGATGVQNHLEGLWGRAKPNFGEIYVSNQRFGRKKRKYMLSVHTLSVEEIINQDIVASFDMGCIFEHLLHVMGRSDAHVLLPESLDVGVDVDILLKSGQRFHPVQD
jgi:hypothetical protein